MSKNSTHFYSGQFNFGQFDWRYSLNCLLIMFCRTKQQLIEGLLRKPVNFCTYYNEKTMSLINFLKTEILFKNLEIEYIF